VNRDSPARVLGDVDLVPALFQLDSDGLECRPDDRQLQLREVAGKIVRGGFAPWFPAGAGAASCIAFIVNQ
jgi:hypothetical protein